MRQYKNVKIERQVTTKIICNMCGKEIPVTEGVPEEDVLSVEKQWGYFSKKDGEVHRFDLCEDCYDRLIQSFQVPVERE